jgi:hypothetical protein
VFQSLSRTPNQASYQHQAKTALEFDVWHQVLYLRL